MDPALADELIFRNRTGGPISQHNFRRTFRELLVLADLVARVVLAPAELPIGVVTAFVGAPFFAGLLWFGARRR